jgi:hypothetical protein
VNVFKLRLVNFPETRVESFPTLAQACERAREIGFESVIYDFYGRAATFSPIAGLVVRRRELCTNCDAVTDEMEMHDDGVCFDCRDPNCEPGEQHDGRS